MERISECIHELNSNELRKVANMAAEYYCKNGIEKTKVFFDIHYSAHYTDEQLENRMRDNNWWRKQLIAEKYRKHEMLQYKKGLVGDKHEYSYEYASPLTVKRRNIQREKGQEYLHGTYITDGIRSFKLSDVARSEKDKFFDLLNKIDGIDVLAKERGMVSFFITLTLEEEWHPNPKYKKKGHSWNGKSPKQAQDELAFRWKKIRESLKNSGLLAKEYPNFRVVEPHKDGCPHWHVLVWIKKENLEKLKRPVKKWFPIERKFKNNKGEWETFYQADIREIKKKKGDKNSAKPSSYVQKYLWKNIGNEDNLEIDKNNKIELENNTVERVDAWRGVWRLRAYQIGGIPRNARGVWSKLRKLKKSPNDDFRKLWKIAKKGCFASFLKEMELMNINAVKNEKENKYGEVVNNYIGIQTKDSEIITKTGEWKLTREAPLTYKNFEIMHTVNSSIPRAADSRPLYIPASHPELEVIKKMCTDNNIRYSIRE
ncbi:MAG: replication endonuclease [Candidatus Thiodiazotropha sp.]